MAPISAEQQDPVEQLDRALAQTARLVEGVRPDQADAPTPCASWEVARLISHLVHDLHQFTTRARGGMPDRTAGFPDVDPAEWTAAFRTGADRLLAAWRAGTSGLDADQMRFTLAQQTAELAVHGWDLARATGRRTDRLDDGLAAAALGWAQGALQAGYRGSEEDGKAFGPQVPVAGDAGAQERLAAFFGRDPRWTAAS